MANIGKAQDTVSYQLFIALKILREGGGAYLRVWDRF